MVAHSKRYRALDGTVEKGRRYSIEEAVGLVKKTATAKFDESVEVMLQLGIDPKRTDQMVRGAISLPKGTGKKVRIIAFAVGQAAEEAMAAGAVEAGDDDLIAKVQGGWTDFDVAIAHPELMSKVGRLGRILGPKGLMPSPRSGTVTDKVAEAVEAYMGGRVEFRADAGGCVHALVGKVSFAEADLAENIRAFVDHVAGLKPSATKGIYMRKGCIASTMGPGVEIAVR
jgi:large subunit ribosomal protein L1